MKPVLVHLHLFYPQMWPELKSYLQKLRPYPCRLYITAVAALPEVEQDLRFWGQEVHFEVVDNRGYDLGAFVHVLNKVELSEYEYVIKLHSKRDVPQGMIINNHNVGGERWRKYSFSFMNELPKCFEAFERDPTLGMTADYHLISYRERSDWSAVEESRHFLEKLGLPVKRDFAFVAGTMFMCRASLMQPLKRLGLVLGSFGIPDRSQKTSLAHTLERLVGWMVIAQGYKIRDCFTPRTVQLFAPLRYLKNFIFRWKVTKNNRIIVKICKIPVWDFRYRKGSGFSNERQCGESALPETKLKKPDRAVTYDHPQSLQRP